MQILPFALKVLSRHAIHLKAKFSDLILKILESNLEIIVL